MDFVCIVMWYGAMARSRLVRTRSLPEFIRFRTASNMSQLTQGAAVAAESRPPKSDIQAHLFVVTVGKGMLIAAIISSFLMGCRRQEDCGNMAAPSNCARSRDHDSRLLAIGTLTRLVRRRCDARSACAATLSAYPFSGTLPAGWAWLTGSDTGVRRTFCSAMAEDPIPRQLGLSSVLMAAANIIRRSCWCGTR